jgi:arylsulfatase A-like enzyme
LTKLHKINPGLLAWALALLCVLLPGCGGEEMRPNVLLIVLDDFGYNDLAINNGSDSPTPTLDQLASEGLRFTRHYTESSCTPSRVALLTGRYPARLGFHPAGSGIAHEVETLADVLSAQGYSSHMIGKWHAGDAHRESRPEYQGFNQWFGFVSQMYLAGPHKDGVYRRGRPTYINPWLENEKGQLRQYQGHLSELLTGHALEVMQTETDPWFIYLSYYAPHGPVQPAPEYAERFSKDDRGRYQALKSQLDTNIGRVLQQLEDSGERDNTMVLVVSDNGGTATAYPSNLPFEGVKAAYGEGGVRTPLIVSWPGHWEGGETRERTTMIFDLYPSILSALGIPVPAGVDGTDMFAVPSPRSLRWYSHGFFGDAYSVLSGDGQWRLITWMGWSEVVKKLLHAPDFFASGSDASVDPELVRHLDEPMQAWISDATRVDGLAWEDKGEWRDFTRDAFRRSPLLGAHSMGFVFRSDKAPPRDGGPRLLVEQEGYIKISERGDELLIEVDGNSVEVEFPGMDNQCASIVISSIMNKNSQVFFRENSMSFVHVYVNGEPVLQSVYRNPELNPASPKNPLRVRLRGLQGRYMPSSAEVHLSTRFFQPLEVATRVHPELLASCEEH